LQCLHRLPEASRRLPAPRGACRGPTDGGEEVDDVAQILVARLRTPAAAGKAGRVQRILGHIVRMRAAVGREVVVALPSEDADVADIAGIGRTILEEDALRS